MVFDLSGKKAIVTGATGGIGKAIAGALHSAGAEVLLTGRREEVLKENVGQLGERAHYLACDIASKEEVEALVDQAIAALGGVDILVCNAGITRDNLALRMKDEEWQQVLDVNLNATFLLNRAALKKMVKQKYGRIINIASVVGVAGNPGQANYVASKAGMIGMSKALAQETAARNITVNCIAPGFIATPMTDVLTDAQKEKIISTIPCKALGAPEDIAAAAVYLASSEAAYVTGQTLHVNGGMLMI